jgi:hypothetical protein
MMEISAEISGLIDEIEPLLKQMTDKEARESIKEGGWSKKQILGHLIDSAANNHQRVVRGIQNQALAFPTYDQDQWVTIHGYNEVPWVDLVELFCRYNRHLCRVIEKMPGEALRNPCNIGRDEPVILEFIIKDYLRHLRHHIDTIVVRKI